MRPKKEAVLCFESNDEGLPKVLRDYCDLYRAISQVLDQNRVHSRSCAGDFRVK
jgi:hypothetical protein